jgi:trans-aconitate methyltransferase
MQKWDSKLYDNKHSFVTEYGNDVVKLLNPKSGELILDLGCGTGVLAQKIADSGATVIGIDGSQAMVDEAIHNYPDIKFICADGQNFDLGHSFDAVFSNAALHWMMEPKKVIRSVNQALKPGGRFVFEMGGKGNIQNLLHAIDTSAKSLGITNTKIQNYYPSIAEYSSLLESDGFEINFAHSFARPTLLEGPNGLRNWIKMFRSSLLEQIDPLELEKFYIMAEDLAKPLLFKDGVWMADYVRLRMIARKSLS